ncbi:MAG: restriction endonuclease subunit S [Bacteroidales bacterium]|nr:restriction endonuclease subunit S [Bacteroidales bacterium]
MTKPNTTYKPLGDYIRPVDIRNRDLKVTTLLGLSIEKCFIPSIANTIGTDMSTYKVVMPGQFAYGPVTSRNGDKITIALYTGDEPAIISQAYVVFEIVDREQLLPEYLMMWFRRPEFDRYARYHSHGSAREIFDWAEMCATMVPVPPISEQRAVVADYEAVARRIAVAKRTIATLQTTAQTLYRKMFVDGIDKENLPEGWRWGTLGEVCEVKAGGDAPAIVIEERTSDCPYPIYANGFEKDGLYGFTNAPKITKPSFTISARGTIGYCCIRKEPYVPIVRLIVVIPNDAKMLNYFAIHFQTTKIEGDGSVQGQLTVPNVEAYKIAIPPMLLLQSFNKQYDVVSKGVELHSKEIEKLTEIQTIILSGLGR